MISSTIAIAISIYVQDLGVSLQFNRVFTCHGHGHPGLASASKSVMLAMCNFSQTCDIKQPVIWFRGTLLHQSSCQPLTSKFT